MKKLLPLFFILVTYFLTSNLDAPLRWCSIIMMGVASLWIFTNIPLHISGLMGVCSLIIYQPENIKIFLAPFADPIIFLFMGGFFLAKSIELHQIDRWICYRVLTLKGIRGNTAKAMMMMTLLTALFSGILSNAATAALFIPLGIALLKDQPHHRFDLLLLISAGATIGGLITPLGSAPNLIALGVLERMTGKTITFIDWILIMLPISLLYLGFVFLVFKKELQSLTSSTDEIDIKLMPLSLDQKKIITLFSLAFLAWILPPLFSLPVPETLVAMILSCSLFLTPSSNSNVPLLPWSEAAQIDWGTLLLFGSGLSLAQSMQDMGLSQLIATQFDSLKDLPILVMFGIMIFSALALTEVTSNTALANILVPILLSISRFSDHPKLTVIIATLAVNLAFMLPVGTPPNAMVFATGKVSKKVMMKKGFILNVISLIYILLIAFIGMTFF